MPDKKQPISHKLSKLFRDLWTLKKRNLFLTFLIIAFLFISTITGLPGSKTSEIQSQFGPSSTPIKLLGMWPYGSCQTSAVDANRNIALIGNGHVMQVLDISTPSTLSKRGEVNLGRSAQDITISGNYAYVVTRRSLKMIDISDLNDPYEVWSIYFESSDYLELCFQSISLSSGYLYVAARAAGLLIYNISDPYDPVFQAWYYDDHSFFQDVAVWGGYAVCECATNPQEWTNEVIVIDVSNPSAPHLTGIYQKEGGYSVQGIDVSSDGYAYICQYNESFKTSKIAVIALATDPTLSKEVGSYKKSGRNFEGVTLSGTYAFFYENRRCLVIINISTPSSPFYVGECEVNYEISELDISGNFIGVSRGKGFSLYDISTPGSPSSQGYFDTPDKIFSFSNPVVASGNYVYMACGHDGLRIMDVSDPSNPQVIGLCADFNAERALAVSGKYAFCISRSIGVQLYVVDISYPSNPELVASLELPRVDPPGNPYDHIDMAIQGNYAYISGTKWISQDFATLVIVDISDPINPITIGTYVCPVESCNYGGIALSGNYAYLAVSDHSIVDSRRAGLRVIDISNPANPREVNHYISNAEGSHTKDLVIRDNYAYLAGDWLTIIDISYPESLSEIYSYSLGCCKGLYQVALSGDYAYLGNLRIFDISNPKYTREVGRYHGEFAPGVAVSGNFIYVLGSLCILKNRLAPEVSITAPSTLSFLHDSVSITAQASHGSGIDRVECYVDDKLLSTDYTSTYIYKWDTDTVENGSHKIRVRAYNNSGKSSDSEIGVIVRNYDLPLNFAGQKVLNRSLAQSEYINVLTWQSNPNNVNIVKYRIYQLEGNDKSLLVELNTDTLRYWHRRVEKDKRYTYALVAVDGDNIESEPAYITVP